MSRITARTPFCAFRAAGLLECFLSPASTFCGVVAPFQKLAKRRAPVTVIRLFFGTKFGKRLSNLREIKQRIVPEAIRAARGIENHSLGCPAKGFKGLPVAGGG